MSDTITITGNIATPPERKVTGGGVTITSFRLASSQRRYDKATGGWIDGDTNWYTVSTFRGLAEHAYDSFHKGERVIVTGRLRLREWENGEKKGFAAEVDADAVGHDLLWGTTRFRKDEDAAQPPLDPVQLTDDGATSRAGDWGAAPGTGDDGADWAVIDAATGEVGEAQAAF